MFKHTRQSPPVPDQGAQPEAEQAPVVTVLESKPLKDTSPAALRELLEKNLKWAQIIYEQNRRINNKLFWSAFGSWFRVMLFFLLLGSSVVFLSPFFKKFVAAYNTFARQNNVGEVTPTSSLESILKFLPLDAAQKEQLKIFLK